jgi:murein DD-endopeptidase MepM/ murein hydrolase activator NlpD
MTFGIDISTHQAGIDLVRAKAEGVAFVIVKAVAAYLPEHTVADDYQSNVDAVVAAGLPKGHYLVVNSRNTPEASAKFLAENVHQYSGGDVLALDNEPLDGYPVFWKDAEAARFFIALHNELGHPFERMWLYCPAHLTRQNGPWDETLALGVRIWWVSYGSGTNDSQTPDHSPLLGGGITRWDVHQFTSDADVAGLDRVDGNFTPHPVSDLFGGVDVGYLEARPAKGNMNQGFGPRPKPTPTSPAIHYGQDYGWGGGDAIYAARGGTIASYGYAGAYGNRLVIDHGGGRQTWYCHLASAVRTAGWVSAGEHIAWMGATGNVTAKHLHFELRINGVASDPEPYFSTGSTAGGGYTPIEEDDMFTPEDRAKLDNIYSGLYIGGPAVPGGGSIVNLIDGLANRVWWDSTVDRNGDHIPALQELADAKTLALRLEAQVAALTAAVGALAAGSGADPQAIEDAARAGAEEALKGHADGVAAAVREKFRTDPLI